SASPRASVIPPMDRPPVRWALPPPTAPPELDLSSRVSTLHSRRSDVGGRRGCPLTGFDLRPSSTQRGGGRPSPQPALAGITGRISRLGWSGSWKTRFVATRHRLLSFSGSPVLGFTSKRGKLLLDTSSRMRWPGAKTSAVG